MPANTFKLFQNANYMTTTISLKVKLVLPCVGVIYCERILRKSYQIRHNLAVLWLVKKMRVHGLLKAQFTAQMAVVLETIWELHTHTFLVTVAVITVLG